MLQDSAIRLITNASSDVIFAAISAGDITEEMLLAMPARRVVAVILLLTPRLETSMLLRLLAELTLRSVAIDFPAPTLP
jgi:hypothetical protein